MRSQVSSLRTMTAEEKIEIITALKFLKTLCQLKTYLDKTEYLQSSIWDYAWLVALLQQLKTELLKESLSTKGTQRRKFSSHISIITPTDKERASFKALQNTFTAPTFLTHFDQSCPLYIDVDMSKERGFGIIVYHAKGHTKSATEPLKATDIEPIIFLSKQLTAAKTWYWPTELEMAGLVWVIQKLQVLIIDSNHKVTVFTDHGANPSITQQIKLATTDTIKQNLCLVKVSMFLQEFNLNVLHKPDKTHTMPDALSCLPSSNQIDNDLEALDINDLHTYAGLIITMSENFTVHLWQAYRKDKLWAPIWKMLKKAVKKKELTPEEAPKGTEFTFNEGLLYHIKDKQLHLCIPASLKKEIFDLVHDKNAHEGRNKAAHWICQSFYIRHLSKWLRVYIKHCSQCSLNQTKRHCLYKELNPFPSSPKPFHTIAMDWIIALSVTKWGKDTLLTITDKFSCKILLILGLSTWIASE